MTPSKKQEESENGAQSPNPIPEDQCDCKQLEEMYADQAISSMIFAKTLNILCNKSDFSDGEAIDTAIDTSGNAVLAAYASYSTTEDTVSSVQSAFGKVIEFYTVRSGATPILSLEHICNFVQAARNAVEAALSGETEMMEQHTQAALEIIRRNIHKE